MGEHAEAVCAAWGQASPWVGGPRSDPRVLVLAEERSRFPAEVKAEPGLPSVRPLPAGKPALGLRHSFPEALSVSSFRLAEAVLSNLILH